MKSLKTICLLVCLVFCGLVSPSYADVFTIGDNDGYGYGDAVVPDGADLPGSPSSWLFDNRSAAELAATDGSQSTDIEDNFDVTFSFDFNPNPISADFTIDISGVQQGVFGGYSHLYFDGIEVADFLTLDQGAWGSDVLVYAVDPTLLADGHLNVFFDNFTSAGDDHIAIDYVSLSVNAVPEPATLLLLTLGGLILRRRKV